MVDMVQESTTGGRKNEKKKMEKKNLGRYWQFAEDIINR